MIYVKKVLLATVLAADNNLVQKYGSDHSIHRKLVEVGRRFHVDERTLAKWGEKVRDGVKIRSRAAAKAVQGESVADSVKKRQDDLIDEVIQLRKSHQQLVEDNDELKSNVHEIRVR